MLELFRGWLFISYLNMLLQVHKVLLLIFNDLKLLFTLILWLVFYLSTAYFDILHFFNILLIVQVISVHPNSWRPIISVSIRPICWETSFPISWQFLIHRRIQILINPFIKADFEFLLLNYAETLIFKYWVDFQLFSHVRCIFSISLV